jgi:Uncharacterised nucleotidyltransferase
MKTLAREDRLLFALARRNFLEVHKERVITLCQSEVNWNQIYATASKHSVAPLLFSNLTRCPVEALSIPRFVLSEFRRSYQLNVLTRKSLISELVAVLKFFDSRRIDVMLTKGIAMDHLGYGGPDYVIGDVDLVVRRKKADLTAKQREEISEFRRGRPHFEIDYYRHHDLDMNGLLPICFDRVWRDAKKVSVNREQAWVMSNEDMLVAVCINSCRKRFFRLKSLCDIAAIVGRGDLNWTLLIEKAKQYRCDMIVYSALVATIMTVGCDVSDEVLDDLGVGLIWSALIRSLSNHLSFSCLSELYSGFTFRGHQVGPALLLPYLCYGVNGLHRLARLTR